MPYMHGIVITRTAKGSQPPKDGNRPARIRDIQTQVTTGQLGHNGKAPIQSDQKQ